MMHHNEKIRATLVGFLAIPIWASLSLLTFLSGTIPPFQLVAMSFFVATLVGLVMILFQGVDPLFQIFDIKALLLGVAGLFGYHFFFFLALRHAPILEATLINYLWPLLIVLFSALLPAVHQDQTMRWWHLAGACMGFGGAIIVVLVDKRGSGGVLMSTGNWFGYGAALAAALVWSSYSVASRLFSNVPTQAVTLYCLITMLAAVIAHLIFEQTIWPTTGVGWLAVFLLGLGPVGGAFYFWDYGMKRGDVRLLGVLSYLVPLLSLLLLIITGISSPKTLIWIAALLIIGGAVLAASDKILRYRS
jgi:drug/metabolite transporter (DMT)-like permease